MSVATVSLGELCGILSGFAWSASKFNQDRRGLPIIRIQNVDAVLSNHFVYWDEPYDERFVIRQGDLLLTLSGSFRIESWSGPDALLNQRIIKLTPSPKLDRGWLLHVLRPRLGQIERLGKHALVNNVSLGDIRSLAIPLPPLAEQRRIAEVLDRAEALRAKRSKALAQLDSLTQSLFLDLFGDPATNPKGWPRVEFKELLSNIDSGWSPKCLDRPVTGKEWGILKLGAVTWCEYNPAENKALPPDVEPDAAIEVKRGDLLFARKNTYELVAACAMVRATPPRLLMSDLIFRLRLRSDAKVDSTFLHQLLIYPTKRRDIQKLAGGSAGSMPNISKARLETTAIEVPPISLQREFARQVTAVEALKTAHRASLTELDALFATLQHRAFRGEL